MREITLEPWTGDPGSLQSAEIRNTTILYQFEVITFTVHNLFHD